MVVMDDGEHVLFDGASKSTQTLRADQLKLFIADPSQHEVHIQDEDRTEIWLSLFLTGFGVLLLWGVNVQFPARRVVLDEASGTALFEERTWRVWREDATMELGEVAAIERRLASYEPDGDGAFVELRDFQRLRSSSM
ncbi:MAG TPA: hypothetical protein VH054_29995 [Polyangiaceae bacterium]|nr:hypothetical protein [Polyangiaceae bacterium]